MLVLAAAASTIACVTAAAASAASPRKDPAWLALRLPAVAPGPVPGYVLIADRNNNRILIVSPGKRVVWSYGNLRDPDDAFFTPGWHSIITNEEFNDTLTEVSLRHPHAIWSYGHAQIAGSSAGYLNTPDDAYRLPNGDTTVADIKNCRIVQISHAHKVVRVLGGSCVHNPPAGLASPNGDTPLPDGGLLITEIGGWIDRIDAAGHLVWSVRSPVSYPSDAQLLPNGRILLSSFTAPGKIVEMTRSGQVTWSFGDTSGPNMLNKPSLAVRWPNGMIAANDDYGQRVIVINPRTKKIVWQYGHTGVASSDPGYLSKPDGLMLLPAAIQPMRRRNVPMAQLSPVRLTRVGVLPSAASRLTAVVLPNGRLLVLGGIVAGAFSTQILAGPPSHLVQIGHLPTATHDDAAVVLGATTYLFGGGEAVASPAIVKISAAGKAEAAGSMSEPLSDLGAAAIDGIAYLAGGYTGSQYAAGILASRGKTPQLVGRLPVGLRYAGVAALDGKLYVAGGVTPSGTSSAVYAFDPKTRRVTTVATLPVPVSHAPLVALNGALYLIGGDHSSTILRIIRGSGVTVVGTLPQELSDAAAVTIGSAAYILGGDSSATVWRLTAR